MDQPLILDRYRPLEEIAEGGYGEVVLAFDTRIQRRVAIKRLPLGSGDDAVTPAGLAEARTAALLNHPNIVTVHEWDTDDDEAFLIMEFVDGASLGDLLDDREAPLSLDEAAATIKSVAAALDFAHDNGVLHLDIKPENVLVTRDGLVKVTDFGVATLSVATGHGPTVGGTLGYMPLEQLRGADVDERTDVWALASLSYEILTNANPFVSDSLEGAIFKTEVIDDVPDASAFEPDLAPQIDDILAAGLATDARDRYGDVPAFANRLLDYLGDPDAGTDELAEVASEFAGVEEDEEEYASLGLWDRTRAYSGLVSRFAAAIIAAWLMWVGLGTLDLPLFVIALAAAFSAIAAAVAPGAGMSVGLIAFGIGLGVQIGLLYVIAWFVIVGVAWWFVGRDGSGLLGALAAPALGAVKLAAAAPLLSGFVMRPVRAAILGGLGALATMLASAASGGRPPYVDVAWDWFIDPFNSRIALGGVRALVEHPGALAVVLAWAGAAAVMSIACSRASRPSAFAGLALGVGVLYLGYALADISARAFNASATWAGETLLATLMASSILVVLVIVAGPPVRGEE